MLEQFFRGPAPGAIEFQAAFEHVDDLVQFIVGIVPLGVFCGRGEGRDGPIGQGGVLDVKRRVERADEIVKSGICRRLEGGDIGEEIAVWSKSPNFPSQNSGPAQGEEDSLCMAAHRSILRLPKMAAISTSASVSSLELKKGKRLVRKQSRMMPADQMSRAAGDVSILMTKDATNGSRTNGLIGAFEQDFGCPKSASSRPIGADDGSGRRARH